MNGASVNLGTHMNGLDVWCPALDGQTSQWVLVLRGKPVLSPWAMRIVGMALPDARFESIRRGWTVQGRFGYSRRQLLWDVSMLAPHEYELVPAGQVVFQPDDLAMDQVMIAF